MLYTVTEDLNLCIEFKITPNQLLFIKMLSPNLSLEPAERRKASYAMSIKYQKELNGLSADELIDLISRDIIVDLNDTGKTFYEYYEINPEFSTKFALKIYPMVSELHDVYPDFFENASGKRFVAKGCTVNEISLDYLRGINNDPKEHKKVIDDIKWAKKNKAIVLGLKKFVSAKYWNALRQLKTKKGDSKNSTDVTIL